MSEEVELPPLATASTCAAVALCVLLGLCITLPYVFLMPRDVDVFALLAFLPTVVAFAWAKFPLQRKFVALRSLIVRYSIGGFVVLPTTIVSSIVVFILPLSFLLNRIHFTPTATTMEIVGFVNTIVYCLVYVIFQEVLIFYLLKHKNRWSCPRPLERPKAFIMLNQFLVLGVATAECFLFLLMLRRAHDVQKQIISDEERWSHYTPQPSGPPLGWELTPAPRVDDYDYYVKRDPELTKAGEVFVLCLIGSAFSVPLHLLTGYSISMGLFRRELLASTGTAGGPKALQILWKPIVARTLFIDLYLYLPLLMEHFWIIAASMVVPCVYYYVAKREEYRMPDEFLDHVSFFFDRTSSSATASASPQATRRSESAVRADSVSAASSRPGAQEEAAAADAPRSGSKVAPSAGATVEKDKKPLLAGASDTDTDDDDIIGPPAGRR